MRASSSILETIGNTPLVRLRLPGVPARVELWAKCEWFNPGGSVKDRTALSLVTEGERTGALRPGQTIVDSSSGNTAVGLALVGRAKGYAVELVMPESVTEDRRRMCAAYGAQLVFTDAFSGSDGAMLRVRADGGGASPTATSTPTSTATPPTPSPTTAPPAPRSGSRRAGASPTSWPASAPPAPWSAPVATCTSATRACAWWRWSPTSPCTAWRA